MAMARRTASNRNARSPSALKTTDVVPNVFFFSPSLLRRCTIEYVLRDGSMIIDHPVALWVGGDEEIFRLNDARQRE